MFFNSVLLAECWENGECWLIIDISKNFNRPNVDSWSQPSSTLVYFLFILIFFILFVCVYLHGFTYMTRLLTCMYTNQRVVKEMNRLGMLVDISHVNNYTMMDVLDTSAAPGTDSTLIIVLHLSNFPMHFVSHLQPFLCICIMQQYKKCSRQRFKENGEDFISIQTCSKTNSYQSLHKIYLWIWSSTIIITNVFS